MCDKLQKSKGKNKNSLLYADEKILIFNIVLLFQEGLLFGKVTQRVKDTISDSQINNYKVETKTCK